VIKVTDVAITYHARPSQTRLLELRTIPEALPFFITPKAVDENSALLQQLPHWAPCSVTQALEFLTPPYKGHPRVMAYVLRVLETYPPETVTFFMPQLVQSLRYDEGVSISISDILVSVINQSM
jgi:phosphatidylinositol 4-kinase A